MSRFSTRNRAAALLCLALIASSSTVRSLSAGAASAPATNSDGSAAAAPNSQQIRVIGAGLGRTGTFSLTSALSLLGYRPHHFVDFAQTSQWSDWSDGLKTDDEMIDLIVSSGYNATVENPTADMVRSLIERFPESKVVLTVRDSPRKWAKSWMVLFDTMEVTERPFSLSCPSPFQFVPIFRHLKKVRCKMGATHLGLELCELTKGWRTKPDPMGWLAGRYEAHNLRVVSEVPSDRLLVFNVKEGWGPLCQFLGEKVPKDEDGREVPFPNASGGVNDSASLRRLRTVFLSVVYGWIPALCVIIFGCWRCLGRPAKKSRKDKNE